MLQSGRRVRCEKAEFSLFSYVSDVLNIEYTHATVIKTVYQLWFPILYRVPLYALTRVLTFLKWEQPKQAKTETNKIDNCSFFILPIAYPI